MTTHRCAGLAIGFAALGAVVASAQQTPTFRARLDVVRLDVLVADHGHPVRDLKAADFAVLDNGVAQNLDEVMSFEDLPIDAVMALDVSGSVAGDRLDHLRSASRALVGALKKGDRAGLISFGSEVELDAAMTADLPSVLNSLGRLHSGGITALQDASYAGLVLGESDEGRSLLIVFSDGVDTASWLSADAVLDTAKRSVAVVYGVSVKRPPVTIPGSVPAGSRTAGAYRLSVEGAYGAKVGEPKPQFLSDLTETTGGSLIEIDSTKDLDALFVRLLAEFRERYIISYSPKGGLTPGWHTLDVQVKGRKLTIKVRPGYLS